MGHSFGCFDGLFCGLTIFGGYGGGFSTLLRTFLTGGGDLSSLGFELTVGLLDMYGGSFEILTVFGIDLVSASSVVGSCTKLGSFLLRQEFYSVGDVLLCCSS